MSKIGVQFDKQMVQMAKAESKALVCIAVDARFLPKDMKWCSMSLKGPMTIARARRVRELMFEFCNSETGAFDEPQSAVPEESEG